MAEILQWVLQRLQGWSDACVLLLVAVCALGWRDWLRERRLNREISEERERADEAVSAAQTFVQEIMMERSGELVEQRAALHAQARQTEALAKTFERRASALERCSETET